MQSFIVDLFKDSIQTYPEYNAAPAQQWLYIGKVVEHFNTEIIGKELFS
jgi:hypothetical protein